MKTLTLGDHTFSVEGLHPEALRLMVFIIAAIVEEATSPRARGFDVRHTGILADTLGQYAAIERLEQPCERFREQSF
ncbi:hypothetical protein [Stenomitos frigidus]|uniref:Uncharacterized protein n=1 Tax=Stenomitos frigidus ULC18 TaxID=2107698 RepID=A0A2T1EHY5_9CYAN|nr:hypothetical protein [Stenomitos frigidus]PSB32324.1 hypothetical protein C7B82_05820 [Stenomitos frigidus ULC18]